MWNNNRNKHNIGKFSSFFEKTRKSILPSALTASLLLAMGSSTQARVGGPTHGNNETPETPTGTNAMPLVTIERINGSIFAVAEFPGLNTKENVISQYQLLGTKDIIGPWSVFVDATTTNNADALTLSVNLGFVESPLFLKTQWLTNGIPYTQVTNAIPSTNEWPLPKLTATRDGIAATLHPVGTNRSSMAYLQYTHDLGNEINTPTWYNLPTSVLFANSNAAPATLKIFLDALPGQQGTNKTNTFFRLVETVQ